MRSAARLAPLAGYAAAALALALAAAVQPARARDDGVPIEGARTLAAPAPDLTAETARPRPS